MVGRSSSKLASGHLSISRAPLDRNAVLVLPSLLLLPRRCLSSRFNTRTRLAGNIHPRPLLEQNARRRPQAGPARVLSGATCRSHGYVVIYPWLSQRSLTPRFSSEIVLRLSSASVCGGLVSGGGLVIDHPRCYQRRCQFPSSIMRLAACATWRYSWS